MTTPCPIQLHAKADPYRVAISTPSTDNVTYQALDTWVSQIEQRLQKQGLQQGSTLLVLSPPSPELIALFFACIRQQITIAPVSLRAPRKQIDQFIEQTQATDIAVGMPYPPGETPLGINCLSLRELTSPPTPHDTADTQLREWSLDAHATILQTSGSTHAPKAALHTLGNHYYNALGSNDNISLAPGDSWLLSLPMYHVAGIAILMRCTLAGATIAVPAPSDDLATSIRQQQPTHLSLVATQLTRLLQEGDTLLPYLQQTKAILLGGSAIPNKLIAHACRHQLPVYKSYGATELASQITTTRPNSNIDELAHSGHVLPYRECVVQPDGAIWVRGNTLFKGYVEKGICTPATNEEGWFVTGDVGEYTEDGALHVIGRKDSMFISGGENIQPEEIERAIELHEDIEQAIVVDIPSAEYGARPCAFVKMKPEARLHSARLKRYLKRHLASFKIPDRFYHWPEEATGGSIKPNRKQLRTIAHKS